jgi:hypothetical protein
MAITKQVITTGEELASFITNSGFFGEVTFRNDIISCYDGDENLILVFSLSNKTIRAYADSTNSEYVTMTSDNWYRCTAYKTAKGFMLSRMNNGNGFSLIASKTNNDKYAVLLPTISRFSDDYVVPQYVVAWGDSPPVSGRVSCGAATSTQLDNQTLFMPIATHAALGQKSYFADAFFMPVSQYRVECVFTDENGVKYVTDGFVCLRDE